LKSRVNNLERLENELRIARINNISNQLNSTQENTNISIHT
jgi:hypothetical protein